MIRHDPQERQKAMPNRSIAVILALSSAGVFMASVHAEPGDSSKEPIARMVHYSGKVQGVGFRATTAEIARDYPVTGWVRNLDDGRVELLVEGAEPEVRKFLEAVRARWKKNIEKEEAEEKKPTGEFKGFSVRS
jgi:acylphosphatase